MPCQLIEGAFHRGIAGIVARPPMAGGKTLMDKDYSARERDPRPIHCTAPINAYVRSYYKNKFSSSQGFPRCSTR
jgi:hypothetical protein